MFKHSFCVLVIFLFGICCGAQITINKTINDTKTTLEVFSESQRDSLPNVADGRTILNSTTNCINYYSNNNWYSLCGNCLPETPQVKIDSVVFVEGLLMVYFDEKKARSNNTEKFEMKILPIGWVFQPEHSPFILNLKMDSSLVTISMMGIGKCGKGKETMSDTVLVFTFHPCGSQNSIVDIRDGATYELVEIGNQCWIKGYLKWVPQTKMNFIKQKDLVFYEWIKDFSLKENGLCPAGFHIPNVSEAVDLTDILDNPYNQYSTTESYDQNLKNFGVEFVGGYDGKKTRSFEGQSDFFWIQEFKDKQESYLVLLSLKATMVTTVPPKSYMPIRCIKD